MQCLTEGHEGERIWKMEDLAWSSAEVHKEVKEQCSNDDSSLFDLMRCKLYYNAKHHIKGWQYDEEEPDLFICQSKLRQSYSQYRFHVSIYK